MAKNIVTAIKAAAIIISIFIVSVLLGLVIGLATLGWWKDLMFEGVYGVPAIALIVLPVAFLVPFFGAFIAQLVIWFVVGRAVLKKQSGEQGKDTGLEA